MAKFFFCPRSGSRASVSEARMTNLGLWAAPAAVVCLHARGRPFAASYIDGCHITACG